MKLIPFILAVLLAVYPAIGSDNDTGDITVSDPYGTSFEIKIEHAKKMRDMGYLGASIDTLILAVEKLAEKVEKLEGERKDVGDVETGSGVSDEVMNVPVRPLKPVKGQSYRFGGDPNIHTYIGGNVWSSTLLYWTGEE